MNRNEEKITRQIRKKRTLKPTQELLVFSITRTIECTPDPYTGKNMNIMEYVYRKFSWSF